MPVRWCKVAGAVFTREIPGRRSDGTPSCRPPPYPQRAQGRASGSGLSHEETVSAPKGVPQSQGRSTTDEWRPTLHGGQTDVEEDLAAHERAAAKRRRQDSELKDQAQKATGLATATFRVGSDEKKGPM